MSTGEMRRVTAIKNGTVIDHIPAGSALSVLRMLGISDDRASPISLVMNVPSSKHGRKDIIKVEDRELTQDELDRLALIAPKASVAIIRSYSVAEKREVTIGTEDLYKAPEDEMPKNKSTQKKGAKKKSSKKTETVKKKSTKNF